MARILQILRNTDQGIARYVLLAWVIEVIPSIIIAALTTALDMPGPPPARRGPFWDEMMGSVVVAPFVETLLLGLILRLLTFFVTNTLRVAAISALTWGILHGIYSLARGLTVLWPFFVDSVCFLEWQKKSLSRAITVTALIHGFHNLVAMIPL